MSKTNNKDIGIYIHEFMKNMEFHGTELTLYALLFAYTEGSKGLYYGTQKYLAERIGVSIRTVQRGLDRLRKKGYIEDIDTGEYKGIRCTGTDLIREEAENSRCPDINKKIPLPREEYDEEELFRMFGDGAPPDPNKYKYPQITLGRNGFVTLTVKQYEELNKLVASDVLMVYIYKLDRMIDNNLSTGNRPPHNHYKTLKKWIEEDCEI